MLTTMTGPTQYKSNNSRLVVGLIFLYGIVYEWLFFFYPIDFGGTEFFYLTNLIKLGLPIVLIGIVGIPSFELLNRKGALGLYAFFYLALIAWSCIPTIIFGTPVDVLKQIPRFLFFLAVTSLFMKNPGAIRSYAKMMGAVMLFTLAQYLGVYLFNAFDSGVSLVSGVTLAGPFGIFGNITARIFLPIFDLPLVRLTGFWNEPSNASACAFAAFFLLRYLFIIEHRTFWRYSSYCCLAAGLLCLSNAGYLALGVALLFDVFFAKKKLSLRRFAGLVVRTSLSALLVFVALFGRQYVVLNYPGSYLLRAFVGIREVSLTSYYGPDQAYSGRIGLYKMVISTITDNPLGVGLQGIGSKGIDTSGSAPLLWLHLTGILGLVLLLLREAVLFSSAMHFAKQSTSSIYLVQAWIVVLVQHLSYGSWVTPNYLILAAAVLSMAAGVSRTVLRPKLI